MSAHEIRDLFTAIWLNWFSLMSGGFGVVMTAYGAWKSQQPAGRIFLVFGLIGMFLALVAAWRDEHRIAEQFDDRARQQEVAALYAPFLKEGQKVAVRWADGILKKDMKIVEEERAASVAWLTKVRSRIESDFGPALANSFNLGAPQGMPLGFSEPQEHDARVRSLNQMILEMHAGRLPLQIRRQAVPTK